MERGIEVLPYRWRDESAAGYAEDKQAGLAVGRSVAGPGQLSLSPGTFRRAEGIERVVLPSPNGSTITHELAATASGRELIAAGYFEDVAIAVERDTTGVVPLLAGDRFRQARTT